ncbi:transposable element Tcb1 transposase [Trichonephila clavipes]|nr:transposable element Tcb1 transposase [Trichonephila clavipes]
MGAGWSGRRAACQLGHSDCVLRRYWDQWIREMSFTRRPGSGRPRQNSRREDCRISGAAHEETRLQRNGTRSSLATNPDSVSAVMTIVFVCGVWRPLGERINPAFALQRHTAPTAGGRVWVAIAYNTRSPLVLIHGTMTAQRYVHDILQPHVLPLMQRLPGAIFQRDNDRPHTARVSQDCLCTVTTLLWPA